MQIYYNYINNFFKIHTEKMLAYHPLIAHGLKGVN